ncbi:BTB/POZ domain-containing protein 2 isoform X1 [Delphinapterus leucas]|uniref:BTB/POZ domain-containing protein 2 isoform X1 n=1 Tax=Delphinapterus leucas TaxID=9749 RepID=A0A2Y9M6C4_DELLE|nr:BTB/POZ domain-containing protein 2 isoform X1 [Delphinapterus leucas]
MTVALWWVLRTAWLFFPVLLLVKTFFSLSHTLNSSRINHPSMCPSLHPTVIETVLTEDISFPVGLTFRFVLAVGSAVFDAMFNGGMATTSTEIELPDVEPAAFLALLKFLYSDEVQIGPETVMTTLYTAKKYAVPALEAHCVEFLKKNLRADNAFMLLTQARLFDEPQLASLCLENIDKNTADAITAEGFTDIDLDTLVAVLERDTLGIREVRLFNAVVRWSEAECQRQQLQVTPENKRKVLGKALALIRFPLMTIEEFAAGPAQSGILVDREVVSLFLHFTVNPKPRVDFIDRPRCCLRGKECSVNRFQQVESRWGYSGTSDRIRFSVNKRIFVVGFGLYGSIHGPTDYQVNIQTATRSWARTTQASAVTAPPAPSESCSRSRWRCCPMSTTRPAPRSRARTPTTAPRACARSPTSRPRLGPRRASPSATRPGTTMARPWRTGRSLRSSSTPRLSHPTPRPLLPLPRSRAPGGLLCSEVAGGQGSGRQPLRTWGAGPA